MAEIVNLRMVRKQKARADREKVAAGNRALHGRTRAERLAERATSERASALLDGHRLERTKDAPDDTR
ncbi:MAG: DUF4169 family protein [Rhizobiaceae bacterium]|nr:DUF4169 family protein [Rhizobiaceae bacterium]